MTLLLSLFIKLSLFSFVAFGGIIAVLPSLLDLAVNQEHWIDAATFADYFAIAQAAPGPNFMTITLVGWHVYGVLGAVVASIATCWPSSVMVFYLERYITSIKDPEKKKIIQYAAAALAIGLILTSSWKLTVGFNDHWTAIILTIAVVVITQFSKIHPLYLIALGAILGGAGLI
ncbi:chromate transporter [Polynucleobacter sp. MWH-Aus1W21]|jgi:chromate transporter|uniref:chromate transporter n=1 Tax=Polynucleobacter sp. MWH-Aus1W21 TaxID=1855880 RepID=UPI001BFDF044|nr:chromate transporter [Polynucleobacter sp. MWH-Aus1W21]QWD65621.1 chromate transporter [Polynucleobacter sp. MWH-Aus1W21]